MTQGSVPGGVGHISLLQNAQAGSGTHPASCTVGFFYDLKQMGCVVADYLLIEQRCTSLYSGVCRDNFTSSFTCAQCVHLYARS
jgi:hypothetical protein